MINDERSNPKATFPEMCGVLIASAVLVFGTYFGLYLLFGDTVISWYNSLLQHGSDFLNSAFQRGPLEP